MQPPPRCSQCSLYGKVKVTYFFFSLVLSSVHVGERLRAQDCANRSGPLRGHQPVLPQEDLLDVIRASHAHRAVPEQVCAVDVTVLLPLHPKKCFPL